MFFSHRPWPSPEPAPPSSRGQALAEAGAGYFPASARACPGEGQGQAPRKRESTTQKVYFDLEMDSRPCPRLLEGRLFARDGLYAGVTCIYSHLKYTTTIFLIQIGIDYLSLYFLQYCTMSSVQPIIQAKSKIIGIGLSFISSSSKYRSSPGSAEGYFMSPFRI